MDTATENVAEDTGVENTSDENTSVENTSTNETNETVNETVNVGKDGLLDETEKSHKSIPRDQLEKKTWSLKHDGKFEEINPLQVQELKYKTLPGKDREIQAQQQTISRLQEQNNQLQQEFKEQLYNIRKENQEKFNDFYESYRTKNTDRAQKLYDEFNQNLEQEKEFSTLNEKAQHFQAQTFDQSYRNFLHENNYDKNDIIAQQTYHMLKNDYDSPDVYSDYAKNFRDTYNRLKDFTIQGFDYLPEKETDSMVKSLLPKMSEDKQLDMIGGLEGLKKLTAHYRKSNATTVQKKETTTTKPKKPEPPVESSGKVNFYDSML